MPKDVYQNSPRNPANLLVGVCRWHQGEDPQERIDLFKQYGYDTLVVWEKELMGRDEIKARAEQFITGGRAW